MEHKIILATWKTKEKLAEIIHSYEEEGWSVAALGEVFGGDLLVLVKDGNRYKHEIMPVFLKTKEKLKDILSEKETSDWQVCSIGECFGNVLMIFKKRVS